MKVFVAGIAGLLIGVVIGFGIAFNMFAEEHFRSVTDALK